MRIQTSGICGCGVTTLAEAFAQRAQRHSLVGFDNLIRPASESNRVRLKPVWFKLHHADLRADDGNGPH